MTGALALACFVKVCGVVFLGAPRSDAAARARESGPAMRGAMVLLGTGCVAIGLAPVALWPVVLRAVDVWNPVWREAETPVALGSLGKVHVALALLGGAAAFWLWQRVRHGNLTRTVTWDCGYAAPGARMQYTAGSFAGLVTEWFAWILRPVRHEHRPTEILPVRANCSEHTTETVLEYAVEPAGGVVMQLSMAARRLQHGRVQAYLLYLLIGLAALAVVALLGADK